MAVDVEKGWDAYEPVYDEYWEKFAQITPNGRLGNSDLYWPFRNAAKEALQLFKTAEDDADLADAAVQMREIMELKLTQLRRHNG